MHLVIALLVIEQCKLIFCEKKFKISSIILIKCRKYKIYVYNSYDPIPENDQPRYIPTLFTQN